MCFLRNRISDYRKKEQQLKLSWSVSFLLSFLLLIHQWVWLPYYDGRLMSLNDRKSCWCEKSCLYSSSSWSNQNFNFIDRPLSLFTYMNVSNSHLTKESCAGLQRNTFSSSIQVLIGHTTYTCTYYVDWTLEPEGPDLVGYS